MTDGLLARTTAVIEAVVEAGGPIGPRALARSTGIDRSAVGRILQQLDAIGVLAGDNGRYRPGPRLFALGRMLAAVDDLPSAAAEVLAELVAEFDETSYICLLHGDAAVFMYEHHSSKPLRYVVELGMPVPLNGGAAGRSMLIGLPEPEAAELLASAELVALTAETILDPAELLELRRQDGARGYAISRGERVDGGVAVGSPFFDNHSRCQGSVVLTSPQARFEHYDEDAVGLAVKAAADTLSARLGAGRR